MTIDEFQFSYYLWELAHNIPAKISLILEISRAMSLKASKYFLRIILSPQALKKSSTALLLKHVESGGKTHVLYPKNKWIDYIECS